MHICDSYYLCMRKLQILFVYARESKCIGKKGWIILVPTEYKLPLAVTYTLQLAITVLQRVIVITLG